MVGGHWLFGFCGLVGLVGSLLPELLAICMGLRLAWCQGYCSVLCESDPLEVIRFITSPDGIDCHHVRAIIVENKEWF